MSTGALAVVVSLDRLYRQAVEASDSIDASAVEDWLLASVADLGDPLPRPLGRALRRAARTVVRLAAYWQTRDASVLPDWRNGVDEAMGSRGWEPQLEIARAALEATPDPELFEEVARLHRTVHFNPWLEGVSYEEWLSERR